MLKRKSSESLNLGSRDFKSLFNVFIENPWALQGDEALQELLFVECDSQSQRELVVKLISRFLYLTSDCFSRRMRELAESVVRRQGFSEANCQIVAMTRDSNADSGQFIAYGLKPHFAGLGWRSPKIVNHAGHVLRTLKRDPDRINVVLVDEFVGSGQSVVGRMESILSDFKEHSVTGYTLSAKTIVGMEDGLEFAKQRGFDVSSLVTICKGISGYETPGEAVRDINTMAEVERNLSDFCDGVRCPNLGYGEAQALYGRDDGNAPNNVFPVFWWPKNSRDTLRRTLLRRAW